jgi:lipopolysaccharide export system protein LptC
MRVVALVVGALGVQVLPGCGPAKPVEAREVVPELKLEQVRFRVWRGTELRVEGEARQASLRRDSSELTATDLLAILPRSPEPVRIRAPRGQGVVSSRVFSAQGGVTVERGTDVGRTPSARYEPVGEGGRVSGDEALVLDGRGYRLQGTGFVLDPSTGDLDVRGQPRFVAGLPEAR